LDAHTTLETCKGGNTVKSIHPDLILQELSGLLQGYGRILHGVRKFERIKEGGGQATHCM
jgi:hypothetical protein